MRKPEDERALKLEGVRKCVRKCVRKKRFRKVWKLKKALEKESEV